MFPRACHEAHSYTQWMLNKRPLLISQPNVILNPCGCYKSVEEIWPYNKQYGEIQVTCAAPSFFALFQSKSATQLNTNSTAPPPPLQPAASASGGRTNHVVSLATPPTYGLPTTRMFASHGGGGHSFSEQERK